MDQPSKDQFFSSLASHVERMQAQSWDKPENIQSPIEGMFYLAMHICSLLHDQSGVSVCIDPQYEIGRYKVDFLVTMMRNHIYDRQANEMYFDSEVIVECDGHEFHEKTKTQASNDKKRERDLQRSGRHVLRFSGSDIWKDVFVCAEEVFQFLLADITRQITDRLGKTE